MIDVGQIGAYEWSWSNWGLWVVLVELGILSDVGKFGVYLS